ncbi:hypothetical protein B0533_06105 [Sedimentibacter sp. SX930]|nr:hypothetical protein B0533_06105 [Sedimentibacter sp. SX930]
MDLSLQQKYIEAYVERKKKEFFDSESKPLLSEKWQLADSYKVSKSLSVKCEYPHLNGKVCGKPIQNIFVIKSDTGKLLKIGGTCLENIVDVKNLLRIEKEKDKLKESLVKVARNAERYEWKAYTSEEKEIILKDARAVNLIPNEHLQLLDIGIPLPNQLYRQLERAVEVFRREKLIAVEMEKQRIQHRYNQPSNHIFEQYQQSVGPPRRSIQKPQSYAGVIDWIGRTQVEHLDSHQNAVRVIKSVFFYYLKQQNIPHGLFSELLRPIAEHFALSDEEAFKLQSSYCEECKKLANSYQYSTTPKGASDFYLVR